MESKFEMVAVGLRLASCVGTFNSRLWWLVFVWHPVSCGCSLSVSASLTGAQFEMVAAGFCLASSVIQLFLVGQCPTDRHKFEMVAVVLVWHPVSVRYSWSVGASLTKSQVEMVAVGFRVVSCVFQLLFVCQCLTGGVQIRDGRQLVFVWHPV